MTNTPETENKVLLKAAALEYNLERDAVPRLTAKGHGQLAERIIALAQENNIPFKQDKDLINLLEKLEVDTEIPIALYAAVAEIFAYLYKVNQGMAAKS